MHELSIGVLVAALGALDELRLCQWSAHHSSFYTDPGRRVPAVRRAALFVAVLAVAGCGGGGGSEVVTQDLLDVRSFEPVGTVELESTDAGTRVEIDAPELRSPSSPALRGGFCAELRPREHKLNELQNGRSVTEVDVPVEELLARQTKVTVSRGATTPHRIAACTELPFEGPEPEVVVVDLLAGGTDRGLAWLEPTGDERTRVGILLYVVVPGPEDAAIVGGGCQGTPKHQLNDIRQSESVTEVDAELSALIADRDSIVAGDACGVID
jgi:hypothetical protein